MIKLIDTPKFDPNYVQTLGPFNPVGMRFHCGTVVAKLAADLWEYECRRCRRRYALSKTQLQDNRITPCGCR